MPNYTLNTHLIARLGSELVSDLTTPSMPLTDTQYLDMLLENSEGLINGFLNKYYDIPIVTDHSNGFLRELTLDLTEYEIWKRSVADDVPTKYKDSHKHAMDILLLISEGKLAPFDGGAKNSSIDIASDTMQMGEEQQSVI